MGEVDRVIFVHSTWSREKIRARLEPCGRICGLYPYRKVNSTETQHYFVRLEDVAAVQRARELNSSGFTVHLLRANHGLINRYMTVSHGLGDTTRYNRFGQPPSCRPQEYYSVLGTPPATTTSTYDKEIVRREPPHGESPLRKGVALPTSPRQGRAPNSNLSSAAYRDSAEGGSSLQRSWPHLAINTRHSASYGEHSTKEHKFDDLQSRAALPLTAVTPTPTLKALAPKAEPQSGTALPYPVQVARGSHPIILRYQSFPVEIDMSTFMDKPDEFVGLLKATDADHNKWMEAAIHFCRQGFPQTSLRVVSAMVDELAAQYWDEKDLKPSLLMLCRLERECAKQAVRERGPASEEAAKHRQNAIALLQRVFGQSEDKPEPWQALPAKHQDHGSGILAKRLLLPGATKDAENARLAAVKTDLAKLQDKNAEMKTELEKARVAKRKAEENFEHERQQRRRLERKLQDVEVALDKAHQMEECAHEQVKSEMLARREAEKRLDRERREWKETEQRLHSKALESISAVFGSTTRSS